MRVRGTDHHAVHRDAALLRRDAFGFINDCGGLRDHPALRRVTVETEKGPIKIGAPPAKLSDGVRNLGAVPRLGEHSAAIRAEFGG
jgi:crotonobetainyl-CoA:carnitine CoA-transferase CaiB-like acyl-CoA transferase